MPEDPTQENGETKYTLLALMNSDLEKEDTSEMPLPTKNLSSNHHQDLSQDQNPLLTYTNKNTSMVTG